MEEKIFRYSMVTSLLVHTVFLAGIFFAHFQQAKRYVKSPELVYQTSIKEIKDKISRVTPVKSVSQKPWMREPKILDRKDDGRLSAFAKGVQKPAGLPLHKKLTQVGKVAGKRHISVPLLKSEKITNPKYLNYHERIRDKIKNRAYFYVDDPQFREGEVYLTFVLHSNGTLKGIKIIDDKTAANDFLRGIGLRSIKESSPFPAFPPDLNYPELSFNVIISFKVQD